MSGGNLSDAQTGAGLQQGGLQQQGIQPGNAGQQQPPAGTPITCDVKGDFADWLSRQNGSVVISTYQAGKIAMVGWNGQQTSIVMRDFQKPMGLAVDGKRLAMATRDQVIFFANAKALAHDYMPDQKGRYDALYMPRLYYNTCELMMHDMAYGNDGLWAVNTRFCCLCKLSEDYSFVPTWQPHFITDLVPEDRCHLNGLALKDGEPAYVTALGTTNKAGAWREDKVKGGVIMDVASNEIIVRGLCMPHSPRLYRDKLWVLNSGVGELCTVDIATGELTTVTRLPGFLRGIQFVGDYALIGMSKVREKHLFAGMPVTKTYDELFCGVAVVDLRNGSSQGMFQFTGGCNELYDVLFLPGVLRPNILNAVREKSAQGITAPDFSYWLRPAKDADGKMKQQGTKA